MIGIALEGGGARGAYQAGAYLALKECGIKPKMIAGTSIGALNAALIVQGDLDKMIDLWINTTTEILGINSDLVSKIKSKNIHLEDFKLGLTNLKLILKNKGIDTTLLLKSIKENINEKKVRNSKIKYGLVTVKVKGFTPIELTIDDIPEGKLSEYILASCYLPIFSFKKIIDDNYYLDGGFYSILPVPFLERQGCKKIYAIRIKGIGRKKPKLYEETEVIEIAPKKSLGSMIIFDKDSNIDHIKMGYYDTLKVVKNLDGYDYYFYSKPSRYYKRLIRKINSEIISRLERKFHTNDPKIMVIKTIEYLLQKNNYEEYKIYNIKKEIKKLRKNNLVKDSLYQEFINNCKLF
ncbi:MAG: patatin-like phospholipase family protein [Mollicutes bacterium]|nr:patatin-like phospholipase family protein [Mollicutes bacterium]